MPVGAIRRHVVQLYNFIVRESEAERTGKTQVQLVKQPVQNLSIKAQLLLLLLKCCFRALLMLLHKDIFPFHISEVAPITLFLSCFIFLKTDSIHNMYLLTYLFGTLEQKLDEHKTYCCFFGTCSIVWYTKYLIKLVDD